MNDSLQTPTAAQPQEAMVNYTLTQLDIDAMNGQGMNPGHKAGDTIPMHPQQVEMLQMMNSQAEDLGCEDDCDCEEK